MRGTTRSRAYWYSLTSRRPDPGLEEGGVGRGVDAPVVRHRGDRDADRRRDLRRDARVGGAEVPGDRHEHVVGDQRERPRRIGRVLAVEAVEGRAEVDE